VTDLERDKSRKRFKMDVERVGLHVTSGSTGEGLVLNKRAKRTIVITTRLDIVRCSG
jgi:hypothetical protein